jgi:hypothetical protein
MNEASKNHLFFLVFFLDLHFLYYYNLLRSISFYFYKLTVSKLPTVLLIYLEPRVVVGKDESDTSQSIIVVGVNLGYYFTVNIECH